QQVGGDEDGVFGACNADGSVEHRRVEAAACEGDEDAACGARRLQRPRRATAVDEQGGERDDEEGECDDEGDHGWAGPVPSRRSARLVTTRMSMPGSSRTMRERSDPPKISRRRDSSNVPMKM